MLLLGVVVLLHCSGPDNIISVVPDFSKTVELKPDLFGTATYANLGGKSITDTILLGIMRTIKPPVLRIPGGNAMNFWDWNDGLPVKYSAALTFIDPAGCNPDGFLTTINGYDRERGIIEEQQNGPLSAVMWQQLANEGNAKPVWGLNVSTASPEQTLQFMRYLKENQIVPDRVELGNELYFDNYSCEIPSVDFYIEQAKKHVRAVKEVFPNAKIGVPVFANNARVDPDPESVGLNSVRNWNEKIVADQSFYDAVVMHVYFRPFVNQELGSAVTPEKDTLVAWGAVRSSVSYLKSLMNWEEKFWPGKQIWMTEWALNNSQSFVPGNLGRKYLPQHSAFAGLFNASVILNAASFESNLTVANFWQIYGDDTFAMISASGKIRPSYYVFAFLSEAVHTAERIERTDLAGSPRVNGPGKFHAQSAPLLDAFSFFDRHGNLTHLAFINKTGASVNVTLKNYKENLTGSRDYFMPAGKAGWLPGWGNTGNPQSDGDWEPPLETGKDTINLDNFKLPAWSFSVVHVFDE